MESNQDNINHPNKEEKSFTSVPNASHQQDSSKKAAGTIAKGAATYLGGPAGGAAVDALSKTKYGDKKLTQAGKKLDKIPGMKKALNKMDNSEVIDSANNAVNGADGSGLSSFFSKVNQRKMQQSPQNNRSQNQEGEIEEGSSPQSSLKNRVKDFAKPSFLNEEEETETQSTGANAIRNFGKTAGKVLGTVGGFFSLPVIGLIAVIAIPGILFGSLFASNAAVTDVASSYLVDFLISEKWGEQLRNIQVRESDYKEDEIAFVERIVEIASQNRDQNKTFDLHLISAVQASIRQHEEDFDYDEMSSSMMESLVGYMFLNDVYDQETFQNNLISSFFPSYASFISKDLYPKMANDVFEYVKQYRSTFLKESPSIAPTVGNGSCTYVAKGVNINGSQRAVPIQASNIQVRLMQTGEASGHNYGGTFGEPLEGEDLVPFESYAAGCSYQEIGANSPSEAIKAQIIAARSFALVRPFDMGGWRKLEQVNGQWILYTASSTTDQVYCSLEKGCSSNKTTTASDACQWGMIYSGTDHGTQCQGPLPTGHQLYQLRDEMAGKVLVDKDGYIIYTAFGSSQQNSWIQSANAGSDYTQMLLATYGSKGAVEVKSMSCSAAVSSDYRNWKQTDPAWGSLKVSPSTSEFRNIGCLITSLAMMAAKSGVPVAVEGDLNPGTFLKALIRVNMFNSFGEVTNFNKVTEIAPQLKFVNNVYQFGSTQTEKTNAIKKYLDDGYYVIAQVSSSQTSKHFVHIDAVENGRVIINDPGWNYTDLFEHYSTNRLVIYKKEA